MNITETETYESGIYQIELTDPVIGGEDGIANLQAKQLANRTNWLKAVYQKIIDGTTLIEKAVKLATARKISLGGILTGFANFDGSADITLNATMTDGALTIAKTNGLQAALNSKMESIGSASTTAQGIIEIATNAEVAAGTDVSRAVTPAGLKNSIGALNAGIGVGEIGIPAFLAYNSAGASISVGQLIAGSNLLYTGIGVWNTGGNYLYDHKMSGSPSGTWKALGYSYGVANTYSATLFIRVA